MYPENISSIEITFGNSLTLPYKVAHKLGLDSCVFLSLLNCETYTPLPISTLITSKCFASKNTATRRIDQLKKLKVLMSKTANPNTLDTTKSYKLNGDVLKNISKVLEGK